MQDHQISFMQCMQESGKKVTNMQLLIEGFRDDYTRSSDNQELHKECKLISNDRV